MSTSVPAGNRTGDLPSLHRIIMAEWALSGLLANGLASIDATSTLQGNIKTIKGSSEFDRNYWFPGKGNMSIVDPEESEE